MASEISRVPTLGIEIEIPWQTMLQRVDPTAANILRDSERGFYSIRDAADRSRVQAAMDAVDDRYLYAVEQATTQGLPTSGRDGYVEFALRPRADHRRIIDDVQTLYDLDLLRKGERYPLHVTIGGIAARSSVAYLLCSTEIVGDIRPERILQRGTWSKKCFGGMKDRRQNELQLGAQTGVEFRTLEHTTIHSLESMLLTAHVGAKAINADHELWGSWKSELGNHLRSAGLPTGSLWRNDDRETWEKYAATLRDNDWRHEAGRIISRHAALLDLLDPSR